MLRLDRITKEIGGFSLREISLEIRGSEYFVALGRSGAGKTLLLEVIAGLREPDSGGIYLEGRNVTFVETQRRGIGMVHQTPRLFPHMSVRRNLAYGLRARKLGRSIIEGRINDLAGRTGVEHLVRRYPSSLSGGEAQRVALARALAVEPRCLLLDEPISSLDTAARAGMRSLLRKVNREGQTIVHVTHDFEEALSLASRIAVIEAGGVIQVGTPQEVFQRPKNEFVAGFIGLQNFLKGSLTRAGAGAQDLSEFAVNGVRFAVLSESAGGPGYLMLRAEDITIANARPETSARNVFQGTVADIAPARRGVDVIVDIGVKLSALISATSVDDLEVRCGGRVWVSFKASAAKFVAEE